MNTIPHIPSFDLSNQLPYTLPYYYALNLPKESVTEHLGKSLSLYIKPGFNVYLQGDLGTGKTTLTRALLRQLGVKGTIRSPSYTLLEPYELPCLTQDRSNQPHGLLHHFDFYRLEHQPFAWKEAGFSNAFESPNASIVEWPQYAQGLPTPSILIHLFYYSNHRMANITSCIDLQDTINHINYMNSMNDSLIIND